MDVQDRLLTRPETSYLFGWSHGKEVMNGVSVSRGVCESVVERPGAGRAEGVLLRQPAPRYPGRLG